MSKQPFHPGQRVRVLPKRPGQSWRPYVDQEGTVERVLQVGVWVRIDGDHDAVCYRADELAAVETVEV
jgi:hypothetical protein